MEKHANNSHLLPSTQTQLDSTHTACGSTQKKKLKKILWHYLNGIVSFISIGERVSATIVHFLKVSIKITKKNFYE